MSRMVFWLPHLCCIEADCEDSRRDASLHNKRNRRSCKSLELLPDISEGKTRKRVNLFSFIAIKVSVFSVILSCNLPQVSAHWIEGSIVSVFSLQR